MAGIHGDVVIGPVFFNGTFTAEMYRHHLEVLLPYLDDVPLDRIFRSFFQQDGAFLHLRRNVHQLLDEVLPRRWIGQQGPMEWPPRSTDLRHWIFSFGGTVYNRP